MSEPQVIGLVGGASNPIGGIAFLVQPWKHQLEAIRRATALQHFGLFFEMGSGKTSTEINMLRWKYLQHKRILRTLVLCPPIVIENWKREFKMHSKVGDHVLCLYGSGKERAKAMVNPSPIVVTNYESLLMPSVYDALMAWRPEVIVADESHKLKNRSAKRTKLAISLADQARYRYILTGSPILNTPMDLFTQFRFLDGGETFGKNFFVFRATYFEDKNALMPKSKYFPKWEPRKGALAELHKKIQKISMVVKKEDCLDLPPLVKKTIFVELSKEQRRLYESMKQDFIAYINDKACVANLAITKALRLQQIVSGFVTVEGGDNEDRSNIALKENPRAEALEELLSEITEHSKCLVWCVFRQDYATVRAVCERLKIGAVEIHGDVSTRDRQGEVDRFDADPSVRVLIGHPQSAGIGINLVRASYSIFYSRSFSLENDIQAEARNYRGGSEIHAKVTRIDIVARGTIDELVAEKLAQKLKISDTVLLDLAKKL